jgi:hypothetical protein
MMRLPLSDVHVRLLRGVRATIAGDPLLAPWMAGDGGPALILEAFDCQPWASLTFNGMRHSLSIRLDGPAPLVEAGRARLAALFQDSDLGLSGHFVADLVLEAGTERPGGLGEADSRSEHVSLALQLEALTIEE